MFDYTDKIIIGCLILAALLFAGVIALHLHGNKPSQTEVCHNRKCQTLYTIPAGGGVCHILIGDKTLMECVR